MISECPHCRQALKFSEAQLIKLESTFARLPPGGIIKLQCPLCNTPIELGAGGALVNGAAPKPKPSASQASAVGVEPPKSPDVSWLASGAYQEQEELSDIPMALCGPRSAGRLSSCFISRFIRSRLPMLLIACGLLILLLLSCIAALWGNLSANPPYMNTSKP